MVEEPEWTPKRYDPPPAIAPCHLVVVASRDARVVGDQYPLDPRFEYVVGRPPVACGWLCEGRRGVLFLHDAISRIHALFVPTADGWTVQDLVSTTGTWVNGAIVQRALLRVNDRVRFGHTDLELRAGAPTDRILVLEPPT